jgi:trk system potassium uptake protein TrkA
MPRRAWRSRQRSPANADILAEVKVLIVGCGRVGSTLAREMARDGHDVSIVDVSRRAFDRLGPDFPGRVILGSGIDQEVLDQAGAGKADCFISVTNGDNRNLMSAQVAKEIFKIPKVMTRVYDPIRERVYREMGLYTYCPTVIGAAIARSYFDAGAGEADRARHAVTASEASGVA